MSDRRKSDSSSKRSDSIQSHGHKSIDRSPPVGNGSRKESSRPVKSSRIVTSRSGSREPRRRSGAGRHNSRSRSVKRSRSRRRASRSVSRSRGRASNGRGDRTKYNEPNDYQSSSRRGGARNSRTPPPVSYSGGRGRGGFRQMDRGAEESKCLGVFGLSLNTDERELRDVFSHYGPIEDVRMVLDYHTQKSRGFAFIYMKHLEDAVEAKENAAGTDIDGRPIRVDYSFTERAHTPTPGTYRGRGAYGGETGGSRPSYGEPPARSGSPRYSGRESYRGTRDARDAYYSGGRDPYPRYEERESGAGDSRYGGRDYYEVEGRRGYGGGGGGGRRSRSRSYSPPPPRRY